MSASVQERITIRTSSPLAGSMVKALLTVDGPRSADCIELFNDPNLAPKGVHLEVEGADGWLFLSLDPSPNAFIDALNTGAAAVLTMDSTAGEIERSLEALRGHGMGYLPIEVLRQIAGNDTARDAERLNAHDNSSVLTQREREVLDGIARGKSNADIAASLGISYHTVRSHMRALAMKLGTATRAELHSRASALQARSAEH